MVLLWLMVWTVNRAFATGPFIRPNPNAVNFNLWRVHECMKYQLVSRASMGFFPISPALFCAGQCTATSSHSRTLDLDHV